MTQGLTIAIESYPLPPSENVAFATNWKTKKRFKSEVYENYETAVLVWSMHNRGTISHLKRLFREWTAQPLGVVRIDFIFTFHRDRIITKAGKLKSKKCDPMNYVKPACDTLSQLVNVDDSYFEAGQIVKAWTPSKNCEGVYLKFSPSIILERDGAKTLLTTPTI